MCTTDNENVGLSPMILLPTLGTHWHTVFQDRLIPENPLGSGQNRRQINRSLFVESHVIL